MRQIGLRASVLAAALAAAGCGASESTSSTTAADTHSAPPAAAPSTPGRTPTSAPAKPKKRPTPASGICPSSAGVLVGVYHPDRLRVIDPCRRISGTVVLTRSEEDGDLHFDVRLDSPYAGMLMPNNYAEQNGALVVELMPRDHGHLPAVSAGDRVSLTGAYVDDTQHDWAEIHPVWALSINGGPTYRSGSQYGGSLASARSGNAVAACTTNTGAGCVGYGGATSSTTSGRSSSGGSGSSSSTGGSTHSSASSESSSSSTASGQIVHPGAFCAPEGARGVTVRGTPMTCKPSATDPRARWRRSD